MLSKEVLKQGQDSLLGKWMHWFPHRGLVAYCGFVRKSPGHRPDPTKPNCPTCDEMHRINKLRGNN